MRQAMAFSFTCCRFTHVNNSNGSYRLETTVTAGGTNRSPVSTMPPIVSWAKDAVCQFSVPAADADGDALTWRLATPVEMGSTFATQPGPPNAPNAATIDGPTGVYTWDTTGASLSPTTTTPSGPRSYYSTQVIVTDAPGHKIPVDFLIELVDEVGDPPAFDAVPECGTTVPAFVNAEVAFEVTASDPDPDDAVTLNVVGLPSGATMSPELPLSGNPVVSTFSWTPATGQDGVHVVQFTATDQAGQTALCPVTIDVEDAPPPPPLPECEILEPMNPDGTSSFKRGRVIPVKMGCDDPTLDSLAPEISLVYKGVPNGTTVSEVSSASGADSGNDALESG